IIDKGVGVEYRTLERVRGRNIGLRRAVANRNPDADAPDQYPRLAVEFAGFHKLVEDRWRRNHHIGSFTRANPLPNLWGRRKFDFDFVASFLAEGVGRCDQPRPYGSAAEHVDLRG